jgi:RimJ/RimL family protein N-acetyltransferase
MSPDISIRPYQPGDVIPLYEAARESTATIYPWLPWCRPDYSLEDARQWVESRAEALAAGREYELAIVSGAGRFLGGCGLNAIRPERRVANLGYWVRTSERGRGVATAAVTLLLAWAREHTPLDRVEGLIAIENTASLRVAEKAGGTRLRVDRNRLKLHGVPHDAVVFSFTLRKEV